MSSSKLNKPNKPLLRWDKISLVIFDCDGVLTDGRIIYDSAGNESKNFDAHDGMGFILLRQTGIRSVVITGRNSPVLERRCQDLKVDFLFQGIQNKLEKATQLLSELGLGFDSVVFMGDDWNDLPLMFKAAISVCPADAMEGIKALNDKVTEHPGGRGAVRECIEYVLRSKGIYEQALLSYLNQIS
jgi:3-deoxy-D-manno-octulosonate 8-phosphate phosphatase (KDO 8-P phosphatase)